MYVYENGCFLEAAIIVTSVLPQSASRNRLAQRLFPVHSATAAVALTSLVPCSARGSAMLLVQSTAWAALSLAGGERPPAADPLAPGKYQGEFWGVLFFTVGGGGGSDALGSSRDYSVSTGKIDSACSCAAPFMCRVLIS